jgi:viologen exporter family transport system permease protein
MRAFLAAWVLALRIIGLTFRAQLEYRAEFLMSIAFGVAWQVSIIVFATVLIGRFPGMGNWPGHAVLLIAGMRMMSHGVCVLFFDRTHELATMVQEGRLEAFLLRPMPVYRQVQLAYFPSNGIGDLLVGVSMFTGAVWTSDLHWTLLRIGYVTAALIGGTLMEAAIFTTLSSLHLHFPAALSWTYWLDELMGTFGNYPLKFLPPAASGFFTFVVPLAFIAYFPAAVLTGHLSGLGVPTLLAAAAPLVGAAAFIGSRLVWNVSLRHYTGIGG